MGWHHAPRHVLDAADANMITVGTYGKRPHFHTARRLDFLRDAVVRAFTKDGWDLQAWAFFSNHYHLVGFPPGSATGLPRLLSGLHADIGAEINAADGVEGRMVFYGYWDTCLTHDTSYLARLRYVNFNPVKHGLVSDPTRYPWCSAATIENESPKFAAKLRTFKLDRIRVLDDYDVLQEPVGRHERNVVARG
ncbi:MAG: hypothetical protein AB2A00_19380 [Myxococcota bacterium]